MMGKIPNKIEIGKITNNIQSVKYIVTFIYNRILNK